MGGYALSVGGGGGAGGVLTVSGIAPISVDNSDPENPIISYADLHELITFTNDVNIFEIGATIDDVNFAWAYNRNGANPTSQSLDNGIGARPVADRAYALALAGIVDTTTFELSAVGDDGNPSSMQTTITRMAKVYFGVSQNVINTGVGIMAEFGPSGVFDANRQRVFTYDASAGGGNNYLYVAYPIGYGLPVNTIFEGFDFNDYDAAESNLTNDQGFTQLYRILRTNNQYNGSDIEWEIE